MKRVYDVTKEITSAFPDMKFVVSALTFEGENAVDYAEKLLTEGVGDIAGFGRMIFAYPDFAKDILTEGCMHKEKCCICCSKCTEIMRKPGGTPGCVIRDRNVYLPIYKEFCGGNK